MDDCPYEALRSAFGSPNVDWCERALCSYVENPADTWSNLAYVLTGMWAMGMGSKCPRIQLLGLVIFWLGWASLIYHASNSYVTQVLDFLGMFFFMSLLLTWNLERLFVLRSHKSVVASYFTLLNCQILLLFAFRALDIPYHSIVVVGILALYITEGWISMNNKDDDVDYHLFAAATFLVLTATACSYVDVNRVWCNPDNHVIQGHALWHVFSAGSMACLALFYNGIFYEPSKISGGSKSRRELLVQKDT
jgi:Ceramidase